ncbi:MAG: HAMP domain-containing histidine kinase [Cyanobacteria bacterium SZAS LIN-3]|nr:HAMP domain-containing histidine kinase [Cyanobacteria bacterium SZAS LIN-3]
MALVNSYISKSRHSILQKGLVIIFVPLATNLIWLGVLTRALEHSQILLGEERREVRIQSAANHFMTSYGIMAGTMITYLYSPLKGYKREAKVALADCIHDADELITMTRDDSEFGKIFTAMREGLGQETTLIETLPKGRSVSNAFELIGTVKSIRQFVDKSETRMQCIANYVALMEKKLATTERTILEARRSVAMTVVAGIIANLLLSAIVIAVFARDLAARLKILTENARLLPLHKPLVSVVGGNDELSTLDQVLHNVNEQLTAARDYRSSLMQMMAHDLRSPLMACGASLQLLRRSDAEILDPNSNRQIDSIEGGMAKLVDLIDDLLVMESLEHSALVLNKSKVKIDQLIESAIDSIRYNASVKDITITVQAQSETLEIDKLRISQVLLNLISNAIKFSPKGSTVKVEGIRVGDQFRISVTDSGVGIDEMAKKRIFEKFYQTAAGVEAGGSGIGLAIAKLIVEAHGGTISCDSQSGGGSVFWFTIGVTNFEGERIL